MKRQLRNALHAAPAAPLEEEKAEPLRASHILHALDRSNSKKVRKLEAIISEQKKIIAIRSEQYHNVAEASTLASHIIEQLEEKIALMRAKDNAMPSGDERAMLLGFIQQLTEVIEQ